MLRCERVRDSLLQARTILQVVIFLAVLAALAYVVARVSTGWADWVVLSMAGDASEIVRRS